MPDENNVWLERDQWGRIWWRCHRCGKLLGEVQKGADGRLWLHVRHGRVRIWAFAGVCRVCERCGTLNCMDEESVNAVQERGVDSSSKVSGDASEGDGME